MDHDDELDVPADMTTHLPQLGDAMFWVSLDHCLELPSVDGLRTLVDSFDE
jgi:hypothetical protein